MFIIICVGDKGGLGFNGRRQSSDRVLREDMLHMTQGKRLWMNPYSASQFEPEVQQQISIAEDFLNWAEEGDYCFVERQWPALEMNKVDGIVLYRWNRHYPADESFDLDLLADGWKLVDKQEFAGYSHEKIEREIYSRS